MPRVGKTIEVEQVLTMFDAGKNPSAIAAELHVNAGRVRAVLISADRLSLESSVRSCMGCSAILDGHGALRICRECVPDLKFGRLYQRYGITKHDYDRMIAEQGGRCALCPREPEHVDHDHATDKVRGILCKGCNFAMSRVDEDDSWTERAMAYRFKGAS